MGNVDFVHDTLIQHIEDRIKYAKKRLKEVKERIDKKKKSGSIITEHGGWDVGYWEGKIYAYENTLDVLNSSKEHARLRDMELESINKNN